MVQLSQSSVFYSMSVPKAVDKERRRIKKQGVRDIGDKGKRGLGGGG